MIFALPLRMRSVMSNVVIMESWSCLGGVAMPSVGSPGHCWEILSACAPMFFARVGVGTVWVGMRGVCGTGAGIGVAAIGCISGAEVICNLGCCVPFSFFWVFRSSFAVDIFLSIYQIKLVTRLTRRPLLVAVAITRLSRFMRLNEIDEFMVSSRTSEKSLSISCTMYGLTQVDPKIEDSTYPNDHLGQCPLAGYSNQGGRCRVHGSTSATRFHSGHFNKWDILHGGS